MEQPTESSFAPSNPASTVPELAAVVLVLPARNEAATVASVVRRAPSRIGGHPVEVIVVDDGSTDETARQAVASGASVTTHVRGLGLGAAVRTGLHVARTRRPAAVAFCDADGEYAPEELERLVAPILEGRADYVVGSRFTGTIGRMMARRRLGNLCLTFALRRWTRTPITDGQSGYRALSPAALAAFEISHDYNYAQVLTCDLLAKGFGYTEVPISYSFRESGRSFVRLGSYLAHVVPALWHQRRAASTANSADGIAGNPSTVLLAQSSTTLPAKPADAARHRSTSNLPSGPNASTAA